MEDKETKEVKEQTKRRSTRTKKVEEKIETKEVEPVVKEIIVEKKSGFNYAEVIVIMLITLILGGITGSFITYLTKDKKIVKNIINSSVPAEMEEFLNTYNNIINDYYEDVDHKQLLEAGINGMLSYLDDDYSVYMDQDTTQSFNEQVEGKYTGIGVEIVLQEDGSVIVNRVLDNSPAKDSGLMAGDIFLKVNGKDVTDMNASQIASLIKGSNDKNVQIVVLRNNEEKTFNLGLKEVELESVISAVFNENNKKIGYIKLNVFASNTFQQFKKVLIDLEKQNIDNLIIDVRDNAGGYLTTVTDIASLFLKRNKIVYQLDTKGVVEMIHSNNNESRSYPIAVLINQNSASASEILAGALKESYGAKLIGVKSFGKGTVQKAYTLESGSTVKYTFQKWLTPNGNWINKVGITPDIEVIMNREYYENPSDETDNQLQAAIKELGK